MTLVLTESIELDPVQICLDGNRLYRYLALKGLTSVEFIFQCIMCFGGRGTHCQTDSRPMLMNMHNLTWFATKPNMHVIYLITI